MTGSDHQLAVCLNLTRAISRTKTVDEIFAIALDALEEGLGVTRASILLFDPDGVMRFKAYRQLSERYRRAVEGHTPWKPDTKDAEPIVVVDVSQEPSLAPYLQTIHAEGIAAMAFIPLVSDGRVIGKFMLYSDTPRALTGPEIQLAGVIASQVAFAVERTRAEAQARRSEERLRFALHAATMGTWDWDIQAQTVQWSEGLEQVHGLPPGTFDGTFQSYEREIHADDRDAVFTSIQRALTTGVPHEVEYRIVAPDGTVRWVEGKGRVEYGADGQPIRMTGVCMDVTPRKQAELARVQALEEAHRASQRLAAIVESSGDAIISQDLEGRITSWNPAAERMFGYAAAEVVGQPVTVIVPPERLTDERQIAERVRAGETIELETVKRAKDGSLVPVSLMGSPVRDSSGQIVGASKTARDIRDRKRSEAARAELHRRLATMVIASAALLNSPDTAAVATATISTARDLLLADASAMWIADPDDGSWRIVDAVGVSDAFTKRVIRSNQGHHVSTVPALPRPLAVPDVAAEPLLAEYGEAYRQEGIRAMLSCPMQFGPQRAGTLVFYYRAPRQFGAADRETGQTLANLAAAALTTADLHAQLRAERNAAEAARSRAAFLADATAILSRSLDYEKTLAAVARLAVPEVADWCTVDVVAADGRLQRLAVAHKDPEKLELARTLIEHYPPDPAAPGGVHEVIRTGEPVLRETIPPEMVAQYARDAEHLRILEELALSSYICVPLVSARGTLGAITFVYAESGRHYDERDLAFCMELAARASLALENAFAYQRVNEASRVKDEFLATLSHELRTPLNAILGYAQMLDTGILTGEASRRALGVLMRNAASLKQIIDDVLDVARITSGRLRLDVRPTDLAEILRSAVATVQPAAEAKGLDVEVDVQPQASAVLGDPDRLQQVVWNLLSNAVKFTPRGGHVQVRLHRTESGVEIVVSDDGQGIEESFLPHVFERFRQADSRFSREHAGLGLGLAIVRDLVELHGGTVSASSPGQGRGATFTVHLPAIGAGRLVQTDPEARPPAVAALGNDLKRARILAIDNEQDALGLLRVILESAGAEVMTVDSASRALALLRHASFDAIVADIGMPGMDGFEFIRSVRQTLPAPANRVPAAALTAYARSEDRLKALASGFQLHLAKPVNPSELVAAVASLVGTNSEART